MTNQIHPMQAKNLAEAYHDAMTMVNSADHFIPGTASPRAVLERYLQAVKVTGIALHNEHWEARAEKIVAELSQRRRDAWAKALRRSA